MIAAGHPTKDRTGAGNYVCRGTLAVLDVFVGGSHCAGGRSYYAAAGISVRDITGGQAGIDALRLACAQRPDLAAIISGRYPRSAKAATAVLDAFKEIDAVAAELLPECERDLQVRRNEAKIRNDLANAKSDAESRLKSEVLRLFDEGVLDGSNSMAGLREIAAILKA